MCACWYHMGEEGSKTGGKRLVWERSMLGCKSTPHATHDTQDTRHKTQDTLQRNKQDVTASQPRVLEVSLFRECRSINPCAKGRQRVKMRAKVRIRVGRGVWSVRFRYNTT